MFSPNHNWCCRNFTLCLGHSQKEKLTRFKESTLLTILCQKNDLKVLSTHFLDTLSNKFFSSLSLLVIIFFLLFNDWSICHSWYECESRYTLRSWCLKCGLFLSEKKCDSLEISRTPESNVFPLLSFLFPQVMSDLLRKLLDCEVFVGYTGFVVVARLWSVLIYF